MDRPALAELRPLGTRLLGLRLLLPWLAALAPGGATSSQGTGATAPPPIEQRGPAVGTIAPAFRLVDQGGREQTLATLAGKEGLVLLFVRSADW